MMVSVEIAVAEKVESKLCKKVRNAKDIGEAMGVAMAQFAVTSDPPPGCFKILNLYMNTAGRLVIQYDDGE